MTLWGRYYHYSHLIEKETGVQNEMTSQGQIVSERGMVQKQICLAFKTQIIFSHALKLLPKTGNFPCCNYLQHELPVIQNVDIFGGIGI